MELLQTAIQTNSKRVVKLHTFENLVEGLFLIAFGAFMIFAPKEAERLNRRIPWIRTGSPLRGLFGWGALIGGIVLLMVWLTDQL